MNMSQKRLLLYTASALVAGLYPGLSSAAQEKTLVLEEITVTAQKRTESLQDVPLAVTAFDARSLRESGFTDIEDLALQVPNLQISALWATSSPKIFLRGVGNNNFNQTAQSKIAVYMDQVYLSAPSSQLFQMYDLERVEVLRGPQGTLYGKNTTGGAISVASRLPGDQFEGYGKVTYGNYNAFNTEAGVTLPLSETLAARVAFSTQKRDGYVTDTNSDQKVNDMDRWAGRAILRFTPTDRQEYVLNVHGGESDTTHNNSAHRGVFDPDALMMGNIVRLSEQDVQAGKGVDVLGYRDPNPDPYVNSYGDDTFARVKLFGGSFTANVDLNSGHTLTAISGYERSDRHVLQEGNGAPSTIFTIDWGPSEFKQFSQEIRITSPATDRFRWILGGFYFNEDGQVNNFYNLADVAIFLGGVEAFDQTYDQSTEGYAIFGQASYDLTDKLILTGGARWSSEERELDHTTFLATGNKVRIMPFVVADLAESWKEWSGTFAVNYKVHEDMTLYASANRGFTAGGFNTGAFNDPVGAMEIYDPEILVSYELGAKTMWLDRRVRLNATAFYYDYSDLQVFTFTSGGLQFIENASDAEVYGLELELQALLTERLEITAGLGVMDSQYKNFQRGAEDLSGNRLIGSPHMQFNSVVQYEAPVAHGAIVLRADFSYTGHRYYDETMSEDISSEGSDINLDLRASWRSADDRFEISVWAKNVTDEATIIDVVDVGLFGYQNVWYNTPRTFGVDVGFNF